MGYDSESGAEDELSELSDSFTGDNNLDQSKVNKGRWSKHEDAALKSLVDSYGERWDSISKFLKDRTDIQCQQRWHKVVNPDLIKGPWTKEVKHIQHFFFVYIKYISFFLFFFTGR